MPLFHPKAMAVLPKKCFVVMNLEWVDQAPFVSEHLFLTWHLEALQDFCISSQTDLEEDEKKGIWSLL